ncbi:MAG TPA: ferritin-like domain-containing protein [Candidatus Kryptonia bacterium]|nr:ferritin-like domain-containing protein [Candidatus Kryptonia bacterium]
MSDFNVKTSTQEPDLDTAMKVIYQWNYEPEVEELRRLYVKAAEAQWVAERDVDWDRPIDHHKFSTTPLGAAIPIEQCSYWKSLSEEQQWQLTRRTASFRLSNFLHGEQGALMVAAQLVNAVPHTDAKFYAATQTMDEARHVEVFARYIKKLDEVHPIAPPLKSVLDSTLETEDWMKKLVGMQIVVEGLALYSFREMRNLTEEPLLRDLLTYVARDESRHHAYGVQYIERCVPCLSDAERVELEDFALEAARTLIDARQQQQGFLGAVLKIWSEVGLDAGALFASLQKEREEITRDFRPGRRLGPVQGFVIPTLRRCGLLSERVARHYHDFLRANLSGNLVGQDVEEFLQNLPELPADTAAWVLGERG